MAVLNRASSYVDGQTLDSTDLSLEFDNIINNLDPAHIEDESSDLAAHQAMNDPTGGVMATALKGEIQQLRYQIDSIMGTTHWYTAAPDDLTNLNSTIAGLILATSGWIDTSHTVASMWGAGLTQSSDNICIATSGINTSQVTDDIAGAGLSKSSDSLYIATSGIDTSQITDDIAGTGLTKTSDNISLTVGGVETSHIAGAAISQAKLKTTNGSVFDDNGTTTYTDNALPGGEYGFYPQLKAETVNDLSAMLADKLGTTGTYITTIAMKTEVVGSGHDIWAKQRYVTASGEVFWIFILRDKVTKQVISIWQAPDHPCFGNGGKPKVMPHPFPNYDPVKHELIVITPTEDELRTIRNAMQVEDENKSDKDFIEAFLDVYEIDETSKPTWPIGKVTVGLPPAWDNAWLSQEPIQPIKKVIPKPDDVLHRTLKVKN